MSLTESLLADFQSEVPSTRKVLEAIPADKFDWKPHEKSMTLGQLAGHVAENPCWAFGMLEDELDLGASDAWKPFVPESKEACLTKLDEGVAGFAQILDGKDDDFMSATWTMKNGETVLMQAPRHSAMRAVAIHHWIHHRAQLTVYLRLLGAPVPATYGPTADDSAGF
jgi:uncharacterized damage-inducible protein DinB